MVSEQTPLLQTVRVDVVRHRYPHHTLRRFCTILLSCSCIAILVLFFLPIGLWPFPPGSEDGRPASPPDDTIFPPSSWPETHGIKLAELEDIIQSTPDENKVKQWSQFYTSGPHLAGKNLTQAEWTRDRWQEFGVKDTTIVAYDVYINYPLDHRLALIEQKPEKKSKVLFEASLEEDVLEEDGTSGLKDRVPTFHGYSASGNVTAPYVWANYGTYKDFDDLAQAGVDLKGKIALVRYGLNFRGLKVKRAQELGMVGCVIYTDPGDDGKVTEANGYDKYPKGPARQPSSVQRGSVQYISQLPGDPTTPGYPSKPGVPRQSPDDSIPSIPSLPISYIDALPLLKALNGHGPNATSFNKYWNTGGLGYKGVKYNIGPSPSHVQLHLENQQEYVTNPIWNVIGVINGTISDEVVVLGNHRDAWIAGGAADPNSGSSAFNELIRAFGKALDRGWKPQRTIVMASWDGEEYGLVGSTEWVEEYLPWLSKATVAYLNVDVGSSGPHFKSSAAPLLDDLLISAVNSVQSPNQTIKGQTVGDVWNGKINTIGSGSDFTAFQDYAGIPCIDLGFAYDSESAVYHYHSNYDSFDWMENFGDKGWHYHTTIAKVWGILAARVIENPLIPFNATNYAVALEKYRQAALKKAKGSDGIDHRRIALTVLGKAIEEFHIHAAALDAKAGAIEKDIEVMKRAPWHKYASKLSLYRRVRDVNEKYKYLERQFLHQDGLDTRTWFKHTVFAPGLWTGYAGATYPGIVEAIDAGDVASVHRWENIISGELHKAAGSLE